MGFNGVGVGQFRDIKTKTISITSGKGGVGKSTLVANLACSLSRQGLNVLVLDGDLGMANIDVMFGIRPRFNLEAVLKGTVSLSEIIVNVHDNIFLIPAGSGLQGLQAMTPFERQFLMDEINSLDLPIDIMLIDTASGIDGNVLSLNAAAQEIMVVLTPDPSSLTDAYALIKVLNKTFGEARFSIILNMVRDEKEALQTYERLSDVALNFLNVSLDFVGFVPMDTDLRMATKTQHLVVQKCGGCPSAVKIQELAEKISHSRQLRSPKGGMQFFWEQLVGQAS